MKQHVSEKGIPTTIHNEIFHLSRVHLSREITKPRLLLPAILLHLQHIINVSGGCNLISSHKSGKRNKKRSENGLLFSYRIGLNICSGAQKNRLSETVLLSTHNICFG